MAGEERGRPWLPIELTREITAFVEANPSLAETSLSGFCATACRRYLADLERQKLIKRLATGDLPDGAGDLLRLND